MKLVIGDILDRYELAALREAAAALPFQDGKKTAGRFAREIKENEQAAASPELQAILDKVEKNLRANSAFMSAARPRHFVGLMLSRYHDGMAYGTHVDDALMAGGRTDLSFTLFLSEEGSYEGGELVIEDYIEDQAIKLQAGDMVLYPSNTLHRVAPVTRGERLVIIGWLQSWVRDPAKREILYDLDQSITEAWAQTGKSAQLDRLTKTRSNLLRMWAGR